MIDTPNTFSSCRARLLARLEEPAPGRIQILTGPRQVGKTTLLLEIAKKLGPNAVYGAGDDPQATLPGYLDRLWTAAEAGAKNGRAILLLDEVHRIPAWAETLKGYWDRSRRRHAPVHLIATGSSALQAAAGARESLAGRFERSTLSHWPAAELARQFHLAPEAAALQVVQYGGYPGTFEYTRDPSRWRAYVVDSIIEPAIGRDVLALGVVRRPALLRQVFAVATGLPSQVVSLQKLQGQILDRGALETIAHYLDLLRDGYLIAPLERYSRQVHRRRSAPPKLVTLNNALISAIHPDLAPDSKREPERFGRWVENACLAFASNQGQRVSYWREQSQEVDAVLDGSWGKWAVEVKTGKTDAAALRPLLEFTRRNPEYQPLVITAPGGEAQVRAWGVAAVGWKRFLLAGPEADAAAG